MKRVGFKMKLHPGHAAEYKKRHDEIWPELSVLLAQHGLRDYTIFHDPETDILFAINHEVAGARLGDLFAHPIMKKWFAHMGDIMDTNPDGSALMKPLTEVFHMD
ncbi:L-rhamnose mutarotase [Kaistia dalseonensis]|uniref:L-rhamnose mutarotase n=1 Tax=Kaistia dalseonensis TaxID=410840 RepID=A0ABU0HBH7_9HYPH|nr:L-rhamnose mutarotase [Kaistia dalseonensis]MCX5496605.1 L-rhamnose mutarotase [Kaistia dalseonensis]MDQ0439228.1 L-rhamnose mutarotase [Kaistia dalseonensis]